jgi:hypothetical protein
MSDIFTSPHIFVVFQQGAGGNFISSLIRNLISNNITPVEIAESGSAHAVIDLKILGTDYLSFGTLPDDQLQFKTLEEREQYYVSNIKHTYKDNASPQVIWTHDYSNIQLYKKYFPNSRILVITQETVREKIAVACMNVLKTVLAKYSPGPFPEKQWQNIKNRWAHLSTVELSNLLKVEITPEIKKLIIDQFPAVYKYATIIKRLEYFGLRQYVDPDYGPQLDVANNSLFNIDTDTFIKNPNLQLYTVGKAHQSFVDDSCIVLPYSHLLDNDVEQLELALTQVLATDFTNCQVDYIRSTFSSYREKQDKLLLASPVLYVKDLQAHAFDTIIDLNRELTHENRTLPL